MIMFLHVLSAIFGVAVTGILACMLHWFGDQFRFVERIGAGMVGGSMILRVSPIIASPDTTPFSDWSTTVLSVGLFLMTAGRLRRLVRHARSNQRAVDSAEAHLRSRGKL